MSTYTVKSPYSFAASIKDADIKQGIITGYAAHFGSKDSDGDIIMPGAFTKTLMEQGPGSGQPRIKHLLNHRTEEPLGLPQVLKEDSTGLYYESKIGNHALGLDFLKMVESGLITEHSIGFSTIKKTILNPDADWKDQTTQLHELRLWEFSSLTAWGANQNTPLTGMKAMSMAKDRLPLLIKAIDNGTFTDSTFLFLKEELLFLQDIINSNKATKPDDSTLPEWIDAFKQFSQQLN